jgi:hypothetical protein
MDTLYIIAIVVISIIGGLFAVLHFKKQGKITEELVESIEAGTDKAVLMAKDFLGIVQLGDGVEKTIHTVLNITSDVVHYVSDSIDSDTDKKQTSIDVIHSILGEFKITATDEQQKMISLVIENSVRQIEKNK